MKRIILTILLLAITNMVYAQHEHHKAPVKTQEHSADTMRMDDDMDMPDMKGHTQHNNMSHAYSLNLPMNRNGSGTGWLPDNSPMYGKMIHTKRWVYMLHGNVFGRYNKQDIFNSSKRGNQKFDAPNWLMAMGQTKIGRKGLFHFSTMFSLDAIIAGGEGYPLLFQSGETWLGKPLVDRQHPHDLFSELSVSYSYELNPKVDAYIYLGYPGEPALGSVAFMHRPSALTNPDAPISHHWNDGTHITFGVATLGLRYDKFKLEASSFTGREPDEERFGFDRPRFDSWSGRLSFNPNRNWTFQVSQGFVHSPEVTHPGDDVNRTTASAVYSYSFSKKQLFNATILWGLNKTPGHDAENAFLLEASYALTRLNMYTRYEWVQKSVEELNLDKTIYGMHTVFPVNALTLGVSYDILNIGIFRVAGGVQGSLYMADAKLDNLYGNNPMAGQIYIRLYPGLMNN